MRKDHEKEGFGIITFALGEYYRDLALVLLESLRRYAPSQRVAVITDGDFEHLEAYFDVVIPVNHENGSPLRQKLFLNEYSPFQKTLFLDADSIALRPIEDFISMVLTENYPFSSSDGGWVDIESQKTEWVADVQKLKEKIESDTFRTFHGGLYYWNYDISQDWFTQAREYYDSFDESYGLREVPGHGYNEEIAFGLVALSRKKKGKNDHYIPSSRDIMTTYYYSEPSQRFFSKKIQVHSRHKPEKQEEHPLFFHFYRCNTDKPLYQKIKKKAFKRLEKYKKK